MTEIYAAQERLEIAVDELKQEQEFLKQAYAWLLVFVILAFFAGKLICIAQLFDIYREEGQRHKKKKKKAVKQRI